MLRKFFCFARRQASGNAGRVNPQNPLDFVQKGSDIVQQTPLKLKIATLINNNL